MTSGKICHPNSDSNSIDSNMSTGKSLINKEQLNRFPSFVKPCYENTLHNQTIDEVYDTVVAIPNGKRGFLWFTYENENKIAYIVELGRQQKLQDYVFRLEKLQFPDSFALGTILSGYVVDGEEDYEGCKSFIADDIFQYKGYDFGNPFILPFKRKYEAFRDFFTQLNSHTTLVQYQFSIHSIVMWDYQKCLTIPEHWQQNCGYNIRHIQLRSSSTVLPAYNYRQPKQAWNQLNFAGMTFTEDQKQTTASVWSISKKQIPSWNFYYRGPIFRSTVHFWVTVDVGHDLYYLYDQNMAIVDHPLIIDLKTSKYMNSIFRNIPENTCLDKIEESDDEDDFYDLREDKFVDLGKMVIMRCRFNMKFKKWIPFEMVPTTEENKQRIPIVQSMLYEKNDSSRRKENVSVIHNKRKYYEHNDQSQSYNSSRTVPSKRRWNKKEDSQKSSSEKRFQKTIEGGQYQQKKKVFKRKY